MALHVALAARSQTCWGSLTFFESTQIALKKFLVVQYWWCRQYPVTESWPHHTHMHTHTHTICLHSTLSQGSS